MAGEAVPDAVGFVLAGGQSSRMGTDKALVDLAGVPLIARALRILEEAGLQGAIAGGQPGLTAFAPLVADSKPQLGPLAGICSALAQSRADVAVFLSVDMPLLPAALLRSLVTHALVTGREFTLCSVNGSRQTFPVVIQRRTLPLLEKVLAGDRRGCLQAFWGVAAQVGGEPSVLPVEFLLQTGQVSHRAALPAPLWFLNVNRPEDLRLAQGILATPFA